MDKVSREIRESPKLKKLAMAAAEMTDLTVDEVFERICQSPKYPISHLAIDFVMAYREYALSAEKSLDELNDHDKLQAVLKHILVKNIEDG